MYLLVISLKSKNIPVQTAVSVCSPRQLDCAEEARGNVSECEQQCEGTLITNIDHDIEVENYIAANGIESDAVFEDYENFKTYFFRLFTTNKMAIVATYVYHTLNCQVT